MGAIAKALAAWPEDRFPEGFRSYWEHRFAEYPEHSVAEAIDAVKMDADPYVPTCLAVQVKLREWGIRSLAAPGVDSWNDAARKASRAEGEAIAAQHRADNAVCESLTDTQYAEAAETILAGKLADVASLLRRKPLRDSQLLRSLVAEHARVYGIVRSRVMEVA